MRVPKPVRFSSAGSRPVQLEGLFHGLEGVGPWPAAVLCHPHPMFGGDMHNNVVAAIARALESKGVLALRFNFRGVGGSQGEHDGGRGEQADVAGTVDWLLSQPTVDPDRVSLVGYSFGAGVALAYAPKDPRLAAVVAVGLLVEQCDAAALRTFAGPKLFISGEHDHLAPPHALQELVAGLPMPVRLHVVAGADHYWWGREQEVGEIVADFLVGL